MTCSVTTTSPACPSEAQSEIFGNNPLFSGPPANVSTNLENGAVGIFTAYSIERVSKIIPSPAVPANPAR
jgi:hypothetical protein